MINIIKMFLLAVFSVLPNSPFQQAFAEMDTSFMPSLNWFLPLDVCADITLTWLSCILIYYIFMLIKNLIMSFIKSKLASAAIAAFFA